jgi:transposase InsO family protein
MTPQNYYARRRVRSRRAVDVKLVLDLVRSLRQEQPCLGGRKLHHLLQPQLKKAGVKLGRDRLFVELKKAGLLVKRRPAEWPKTTQFDRTLPVFKNLVKGRKVTGRNQVWVADITYIRTKEAFVYLALITDCWSRKIVGYELSKRLQAQVSLLALNKALRSLKKAEKPIHHSDRGCQYASHAFVQRAERAGLRLSMTEKEHTAENAMAERVNGILKQEYLLDVEFENYRHAQKACAHTIMLYNTKRPHSALAMRTPEQVHGT